MARIGQADGLSVLSGSVAGMDVREAALRWVRTWAVAWPAQDIDALVALQTEDGIHWASMFRPYRGRQGLRSYLAESFEEESVPARCWFADPAVSEAGASAEYWAHCVFNGDPVTVSGVTILVFDADGLVSEARDYSDVQKGHHPVPAHIRSDADSRPALVPDSFVPPLALVTEDFRLVPLQPEHNVSDHAAWMGSIEHIRRTPGFVGRDWPPIGGMALGLNLGDLRRHADEFVSRTAFTYTVLDPSTGEVIGCVYLKPPSRAGSDVDVLSWVRADRAHLDAPLHTAVLTWLTSAWPFTAINYAPRGAE
ncbi:nuclear transport factor 2 family protein [Acrocarpospora corrugata]|uniref:nuclear transport factor 2 family protein n=1 Tax=Acrocarpospora corrugata TaxID=35763 RepID=UPI0012D344C8|nr:nuclear transport factor 2 family protein [Acrocarpospora corrugata]